MSTPSLSPRFPSGLVLVGCGRMGGALLTACLEHGVVAADSVTVIEPEKQAREAIARLGVRIGTDASAVKGMPDLVLIAVKPQAMDTVLPAYKALSGTVFLSIAAGRTTASLARVLGDGTAIIRAMPNTPAQVRRGITALYATPTVTAIQRNLAAALMGAVGEVIWLEDESLMDAVTAVSGSGPAYLFHLIEALAEAARAEGLPAAMADRLARATVTGAAELAFRSRDSVETLRAQVTSPGGTTAAALQVLMGEKGLTDLMRRTVAAAAKRSRELGS